MASYTVIGQELWLWAPFVALTSPGRLVWLALYTSPHARLTPPGLWKGSPLILAEQAHLPHRDTLDALTELTDQRMIERDDRARVIAMTMLPDRHERPSSGNCLKKWWNLFRSIPACSVRDRWVNLLHWLCQPWNKHHEQVWPTTFGAVCPMTIGPTTVCEQPVDKQCALVFSGSPDTHPDTLPDTLRNQGSGIRDQGSETLISERGAAPRWAPPPPIVEPPSPRLLTVIEGGLVTPTQEHDERGQPWGPDGPPKDRFINGRRRNL